jgi:hypothetical protein
VGAAFSRDLEHLLSRLKAAPTSRELDSETCKQFICKIKEGKNSNAINLNIFPRSGLYIPGFIWKPGILKIL